MRCAVEWAAARRQARERNRYDERPRPDALLPVISPCRKAPKLAKALEGFPALHYSGLLVCRSRQELALLPYQRCDYFGERAGLPLVWDKTVKFRVTKDMAKIMKAAAPIELKLLGQRTAASNREIAAGQVAVEAFLWQDSPTECTSTFTDNTDEPLLQLSVSCHYTPPDGCWHMAATSPPKVT